MHDRRPRAIDLTRATLVPKFRDLTNKQACKNRPLSDADRETKRRKSAVRSKAEHAFPAIELLWGFAKVRDRGLKKDANRACAVIALHNALKWGGPLAAEVCPA